jgi:hypothetical protein
MAEDEFQIQEQWREDAHEFFFKFWRHWDAWVISVLGGSICLILVLRGILTGISERAMWIVIVLGIIRSAFKTWRDQKRAHEATKAANAIEIATLKTKIDDREKRQLIKNDLGKLLQQLEDRRREISAMSSTQYREQHINGQDVVSLSIVNGIEQYISKNVGFAEAKVFESLAGLNLTTFHDSVESHGSLADLERFRRRQIRMTEHLDHWATQLKELITGYN